MTLRELGEIRRRDPEQYVFIEEAYAEQLKREQDAIEEAKNR